MKYYIDISFIHPTHSSQRQAATKIEVETSFPAAHISFRAKIQVTWEQSTHSCVWISPNDIYVSVLHKRTNYWPPHETSTLPNSDANEVCQT